MSGEHSPQQTWHVKSPASSGQCSCSQVSGCNAAVHDCGFELIVHPPYSPDLAPLNYFLFPNLKKHLAGK